MSLDNAAKIFPAAKRRNWSNVFRLSATLKDDIDTDALHSALELAVKRFPSIAVRVRPGFFWYYIEQIPKAPNIMAEKPYPLSKMPFDDIRKCAFRVVVYKNRIAVEFFHALTDGNGGLVFLKTLVGEYIRQRYGVDVPAEEGVLSMYDDATDEELEDSFQRYAGSYKASRADTDSFRILGKPERDGYRTNTTIVLDADKVVREAKARGVTVNVYMTAALTVAVMRVQELSGASPRRYKPVKIVVPVNLRRLFPSGTLRNFALYATTSIDPRLGEYSFDEITDIINHQLKLQITAKNMAAVIAKNVGDEKPMLMRLAPLFLKNAVMKAIFNSVGEKKSCFTYSNLGVVRLPSEMEDYITRMDFVLSNQASAPYNVSSLTYNGKLYLNIIRNIDRPILEGQVCEVFKALGFSVYAESNARLKEED